VLVSCSILLYTFDVTKGIFQCYVLYFRLFNGSSDEIFSIERPIMLIICFLCVVDFFPGFLARLLRNMFIFLQGRGVILSLVVSNNDGGMNTIKYIIYKIVKTSNQPAICRL
jgi:hypothetical protein